MPCHCSRHSWTPMFVFTERTEQLNICLHWENIWVCNPFRGQIYQTQDQSVGRGEEEGIEERGREGEKGGGREGNGGPQAATVTHQQMMISCVIKGSFVLFDIQGSLNPLALYISITALFVSTSLEFLISCRETPCWPLILTPLIKDCYAIKATLCISC